MTQSRSIMTPIINPAIFSIASEKINAKNHGWTSIEEAEIWQDELYAWMIIIADISCADVWQNMKSASSLYDKVLKSNSIIRDAPELSSICYKKKFLENSPQDYPPEDQQRTSSAEN